MTDITIPSHFGRPTKYKPEFCNLVVEWGKLGKSKAWICAELEISRPTLDLWIEEKEDFSYAMAVAMNYSQKWWEDTGQLGMMGKSIDASIYSRSMAARFPNDWRESTKTENETKVTFDSLDGLLAAIDGKTRSV
jgi:hypothetical protein